MKYHHLNKNIDPICCVKCDEKSNSKTVEDLLNFINEFPFWPSMIIKNHNRYNHKCKNINTTNKHNHNNIKCNNNNNNNKNNENNENNWIVCAVGDSIELFSKQWEIQNAKNQYKPNKNYIISKQSISDTIELEGGFDIIHTF